MKISFCVGSPVEFSSARSDSAPQTLAAMAPAMAISSAKMDRHGLRLGPDSVHACGHVQLMTFLEIHFSTLSAAAADEPGRVVRRVHA